MFSADPLSPALLLSGCVLERLRAGERRFHGHRLAIALNVQQSPGVRAAVADDANQIAIAVDRLLVDGRDAVAWPQPRLRGRAVREDVGNQHGATVVLGQRHAQCGALVALEVNDVVLIAPLAALLLPILVALPALVALLPVGITLLLPGLLLILPARVLLVAALRLVVLPVRIA